VPAAAILPAGGRPSLSLAKKKADVDAALAVLYHETMTSAFLGRMTITLSSGVAAEIRGVRVR
jgi:hypothetical protein